MCGGLVTATEPAGAMVSGASTSGVAAIGLPGGHSALPRRQQRRLIEMDGRAGNQPGCDTNLPIEFDIFD